LALQREHLDADQVALIGSPGVGGDAKTSAELGLDKSRVFVGSASQDIVTTQADSLGADPTLEGFGESVTRFRAESPERGVNSTFADHSRYYGPATGLRMTGSDPAREDRSRWLGMRKHIAQVFVRCARTRLTPQAASGIPASAVRATSCAKPPAWVGHLLVGLYLCSQRCGMLRRFTSDDATF
jgi:hypothetical protein